MQENASLRDKLATLKSDFVTVETVQQTSRDKMIDSFISDQSNMTRLTDQLHAVIQVGLLPVFTTHEALVGCSVGSVTSCICLSAM